MPIKHFWHILLLKMWGLMLYTPTDGKYWQIWVCNLAIKIWQIIAWKSTIIFWKDWPLSTTKITRDICHTTLMAASTSNARKIQFNLYFQLLYPIFLNNTRILLLPYFKMYVAFYSGKTLQVRLSHPHRFKVRPSLQPGLYHWPHVERTLLGRSQLLYPWGAETKQLHRAIQIDRKQMGERSSEKRHLGDVEPWDWQRIWSEGTGYEHECDWCDAQVEGDGKVINRCHIK